MKFAHFTCLILIVCLFATTACDRQSKTTSEQDNFRTFCNPIDLSYRFQFDSPSRREAGDPSVVLFKDEYYLFASKSGGYFHSTDLVQWDLIPTHDLPLEPYAPAAEVVGDEIYFITDYAKKIYKTKHPESGKWQVAKQDFKYQEGGTETGAYKQDAALFLDDDGRLYYYAGSSNSLPTAGVEIDRQTLEPKGKFTELLSNDKEKNGWEMRGDNNYLPDGVEPWMEKRYVDPWIEGSCMTKHAGKYYLQYSTPGTEFKSYCDAVYVSDKSLGPFVLAEHNPIAYKPGGFLAGAGHGATFKDKYGNYWHVGTSTVSVRHIFERRLNLFPVFFDDDGTMYAHTGFGDYPMIVPDKKVDSPDELFPGWMLLSYRKKAEASSTLTAYPLENAVDEEIRTWWSAETGEAGEWFSVDLGETCQVNALQVNFADQDAELFGDSIGRSKDIYYQYTVEQSTDGKNWKTLIDQSQNRKDAPHEYIRIEQPVATRYLKINNIRVPSGKFSLYDFRVFGKSPKKAPPEVSAFTAERQTADRRRVKLTWEAVPDAIGYNIRYGTKEGKLYHNYLIYDKHELQINSLNTEQPYFFAIDTFNEGGVTRGKSQKLN